jgi:Secreted repeat of unknown function
MPRGFEGETSTLQVASHESRQPGIRKDALLWVGRRFRAEEAREMKGKPGDRIVLEAEKAAQPARAGVIEEVLQEATRRADGKLQVTYGGRPLYYYVNDRKPGQVLCQNVPEFGGIWRVVRGSGALVR